MLLIATVDPILHSHLLCTLTEKGTPFLLHDEVEHIVDASARHHPSLVIVDIHATHPSGMEFLASTPDQRVFKHSRGTRWTIYSNINPKRDKTRTLQNVGRPFSVNQVLGAVCMTKQTPKDISQSWIEFGLRR